MQLDKGLQAKPLIMIKIRIRILTLIMRQEKNNDGFKLSEYNYVE